MSNSAFHKVHIVPNTDPGVTPANPPFQTMRKTGCTVQMTKQMIQSAEMTGNRMPAANIHGTKSVAGDLTGEVSYGTYDVLFAAALCGTWSAADALEIANDIAMTSTAGAMTSATDSFPVGLAIGTLVQTKGFTNAANNGVFQLATISEDGAITLKMLNGEAMVSVVEAAAPGKEITLNVLSVVKVGTGRKDFTLIREYSDMDDKQFHMFEAVEVNTMAFSINVQNIATVTFGFVGRDAGLSDTAPAGATFTAPTTTPVMTPYSGAAKESNDSVFATELTLNLDNGITPEYAIGDRAAYRMTIGNSNVQGQLTCFFNGPELIEKFLGEQNGAVEYTISDKLGNSYFFYVPEVNFTGAAPETPAAPGSNMLPVPYTSQGSAAYATNFLIAKIPA